MTFWNALLGVVRDFAVPLMIAAAIAVLAGGFAIWRSRRDAPVRNLPPGA
jgi:hypothetical protein